MVGFVIGVITGAFLMLIIFIIVAVLAVDGKNPKELSDQELQDLALWEEERRHRVEKNRSTLPRL